MQCFGEHDQSILEGQVDPVIWPFYMNLPAMDQGDSLGVDGSITITTSVPASEVLLFATQAVSVATLLGV